MTDRIVQICSAVLLVSILGATVLQAEQSVPSFDATCNASGYVLTPDAPERAGALGSEFLAANLYLGVSCDAYSESLGEGAWCWANGGVQVEFSGEAFGLWRYELPQCAEHASSTACGCWEAPLPSAP